MTLTSASSPTTTVGGDPSTRGQGVEGLGTREDDLVDVFDRGRRVYTGVVATLLAVGVVAAVAAVALSAARTGAEEGGGVVPDGVPAAWGALALASLWAVAVAAHAVRGVPVLVVVAGSVLCAALLPPMLAPVLLVEPAVSGTGEPGVVRVLGTPASVVLWVLAGLPGRPRRVLALAVAVGAGVLAVADVSARLTGLGLTGPGGVDLIGPAVTALLAVGSIAVASRGAGRALAAQRERRRAHVDLLVARDLAEALRRLDRRMHDVVLASLATLTHSDDQDPAAVRRLAAQALVLLEDPDPGASRPGAPSSRATAGHDGAGPGSAVEPVQGQLVAGVARLVAVSADDGVLVEVHASRSTAPGPGDPRVSRGGRGRPRADHAVEALLEAVGECLRNVARHAGTGSAVLVWSAGDGRAQVVVADSGAGFDPEAVDPSRLGLARSVRGRVEDVGGTAVVRSRPGRGTAVTLTVPVGGPVGGPVRVPGGGDVGEAAGGAVAETAGGAAGEAAGGTR